MTSSTSSNFKDPAGLLLRMLSSGNRAAYAALIREGLQIAAMPLDAILSAFEKRRSQQETSSGHPVLLIIGAPRSGTTLVYQVLAQYLDVTFPTNLSAMFPKSPLSVSRLIRFLPRLKTTDFRNFYGQTTHLRGPNDAFHVWDQWLGSDRYHPKTQLDDNTIRNMQSCLASWTECYGRPFLNKNNRNTSCMKLLADTIPAARFIVVKRHPMAVVQSLVKAREDVQGNKHVGWGLQSATTSAEADSLAYVDDVCRQVRSIESELQRQIDAVAPERIFEMTYEDFCGHPQEYVRQISEYFQGVGLNPELPLNTLQPFRVSSKSNMTAAEEARARRCLALDASRQLLEV
ncbi:MAG: sulfotransferase [Planctomycetaceae bacterium]|nr:sulfotransferase [Planctomycetaceae bacterium]